MSAVFDEQTQYFDTGGKPLVNGKIYFGLQNADPVENPITIYSDRGLTSVLANPQILDSSGRATNKIWVPGAYSIRIDNSADVQQFQELDNGELADVGISILGNVLGTNTITADGSPTISALTDQQVFTFKVANTNTGAVTLDIDSIGAKAISRNIDQAVVSGQFVQNEVVMVQYNSTTDQYNWIQENQKVDYLRKGDDIASAATVDLALATGNSVVITGAGGPITSFGTTPAGTIFDLTFTGTPTITHNATSLIIPGQANVTIVAGDQARVKSLGSGNVQIQVFRETGKSLVETTPPNMQTFSASGTWPFPDGITEIVAELIACGGGGGGADTAGDDGGGGGGGEHVMVRIPVTADITVTINTGGTGGAAADGTGSTGGTVQVDDVTAIGGSGGVGGNAGAGGIGGTGGSDGTGNTIITRDVGTSGVAGAINFGGDGGKWGLKGTWPSGIAEFAAGANAPSPGLGGSGSGSDGTANAGGNGADGYVIIWW